MPEAESSHLGKVPLCFTKTRNPGENANKSPQKKALSSHHSLKIFSSQFGTLQNVTFRKDIENDQGKTPFIFR
jgi:hypothetical protein